MSSQPIALGQVVVVGLGLVGGSLVKALRERRAASSIGGIDHRDVLARARPLLDATAAPDDARELLGSADLVVLATPARVALESLSDVLDAVAPQAAVTDVASVKSAIAARAASHPRASRFVPGHPMAGRELGGFEASRADLFEGASWFLVGAACASDAFERAGALARTVGAIVRPIDASAHDRAMAIVSHVPHLVASALVDLAATEGALDLAGPGFRDATRIAGGPEAIWADILAENRAEIVAALDALLRRLDAVKIALSAGEDAGVAAALDLLAAARRAKPVPPSGAGV